ncbi:MAG: dihydroorotate dehydrogenase-like protein [Bacteroides sp.]|nr:dihydroorotate dehydrogenase-like protein [Bacteroides sp.]
MIRTETNFAGLRLRNPIIVSSSGLTDSAAKNRRLEEAGAGAIVLKSLLEEQILQEAYWLGNPAMYPEGSDYLVEYMREHQLGEYLRLIRESKATCTIPIIASINCWQDGEWADVAGQIEEAGADALEINILSLQTDLHYVYGSYEQRHIDILARVKRQVALPVIMKVGSNLTNPIALFNQLYANGAAGIVLFNRFYRPDIDIEKMTQTVGELFTNESDLSPVLRWIGIASAALGHMDYAASGGIHSPESVVKALLAGASAVEMCSAIYRQSPAFIGRCLQFLREWMERKGMDGIARFKGRLNMANSEGVNTFERTQFMKYFSTHR